MKKILILCFTFIIILQAKERIISLDPASVETLFMLKADDQIIGIASLTHSDIYPKEKTSKIASVGTFTNPSVEKIISLNPTLVILSSYSFNLKQKLDNFGIKTMVLKAQHLNDIKDNIKILAKITQKEKEGDKILKNFENKLKNLEKNPLNKSAIYLYSSNPLMAFSDNSLIADILKLIGIKNLSPKSNIARPIISEEYILKQNPDLLIFGINATEKNLLNNNSLLKNTKAVKKNQIYTYKNTYLLLRLSPKIIDRIEEFKAELEKANSATSS
ncbi:ABC transporter substrate-binding protein [Campylobacter sp. RM10532]|uniref:ABC transporter substrate-binding protein n=1 Tax=Campylobacter molothri TaxID=1032242 RepID=UPI001D511A28|nr:ABC transporter substrate-binding protein [Campylobacter sp. RM10532]MBZ7947652.1 ABC transporter substrate-binding protein [Campylobacter sp. RM9929]